MRQITRALAFSFGAALFLQGAAGAHARILDAAKKGDLAAVKQAIANGEDKNTKSPQPFITFGASGFNKDGALSYSQDSEWTALIHAAFNGHETVVRYLLEIDADPNVIDFNGITALMYAIKANHTKVVDAMASDKAALDFAEPSLGMTPLMWAVVHGNDATFQALLSHDPDLQRKDNDGWTALHYAARRGRTACVEPLLRSGAEPDALDGEGKTPLMIAAENGNANLAEQLIKSGADKSLKSTEGKTALEYAEQRMGLGGLKIERIDDDTIRITDGFVYQRNLRLGYASVLRIKSVERGIFQTEGIVAMGAQSAVGVTWIFNEPGMTFHNGDYVYTSLAKDASIDFTQEGAVLSNFKVANPSEEGIKKVIALLRDPPAPPKAEQQPEATSASPQPSGTNGDAEDNAAEDVSSRLKSWLVGGTMLFIAVLYAVYRSRTAAKK